MASVSASVVDSLDQTRIRYVDVEGVRTRYYEAGAGERLVLLHGGHFGFIDSLDCWSLNFAGLAKHFHVYAPDKLGQGFTDNPKSEADYTFEALLQHTVGWFRTLGITQAHVLGHSRGGLLVAALALQHPELAKTVVIVDSGTLAPGDPRHLLGTFYEEIERRIPPGPPTRDTVRMEPDANSYSTEHVTDDFVARYLEIASLAKTQEAQRRMKALGDSIWTPSLKRNKEQALERIDARGIPAPTLVVWGFNDPSAPLPLGASLFERICARTPRAEFHVLNQAGHYGFREHPDEFNRLLRSFCLS